VTSRQGGKSSETGSEALQSLLIRLDGGAAETRPVELLSESKDVIRQHLLMSQSAQRDSQDRLRRLQDDVEVQQQRREELERILVEKDAAYEDLLGKMISVYLEKLDRTTKLFLNRMAQPNNPWKRWVRRWSMTSR
jgi:hypothetical protein